MTEVVEVGKYRFAITRNIQRYEGNIINHTYKIGGDYADCVNISYKYKNNTAIQAKIPHLLYEPECAVGTFLEKGSGTELMIKTAIRYAYNDVKGVTKFEFDDDSHIDCSPKNMTQRPPRRPKKPLNLAFFYIAYNGQTWYESRFNARMVNEERYRAYRQSLVFLTDPAQKPGFSEFLQIIGSSLESLEDIECLKTYYNKSATYREFFENIPKIKRCQILSVWLGTFMKHYIGRVFDDKGWVINVNTMDGGAMDGAAMDGAAMDGAAMDGAAMDGGAKGGALSRSLKYRIFSYRNTTNF